MLKSKYSVILRSSDLCNRAEAIFRVNKVDYTKTGYTQYKVLLDELQLEKLKEWDFMAVIKNGF